MVLAHSNTIATLVNSLKAVRFQHSVEHVHTQQFVAIYSTASLGASYKSSVPSVKSILHRIGQDQTYRE